MKIKKQFFLVGLFTMALCFSAFIQPATKVAPEVKIEKEVKGITENPKIKNLAFRRFLSNFESVEAPFGVGLDELKTYLNDRDLQSSKRSNNDVNKSLKAFIPELESGRYSRMGPPSVEPLVWFPLEDGHIAAIYMSYYPYRYSNAANFNLLVFDKKGQNINFIEENKHTYRGSYPVAFSSNHDVRTFSINAQGLISQNNYEAIWELDLNEFGFKDNQITGYNLLSTENYQVERSGQIVKVETCHIADRAALK